MTTLYKESQKSDSFLGSETSQSDDNHSTSGRSVGTSLQQQGASSSSAASQGLAAITEEEPESINSKGRLMVAVVGAKDLDITSGAVRVNINFEETAFSTGVKRFDNLVWNEEFSFLVLDLESEVEFRVFCAPKIESKEKQMRLVGKTSIKVSTLTDDSVNQVALKLDNGATLFTRFLFDADTTLQRYKPLGELLLKTRHLVIGAICDTINLVEVDSICKAIMNVFTWNRKALPLLEWAIRQEVRNTESVSTLFRGQSLITRLLSDYAILVGQKWLQQTLGPIITKCIQEASCTDSNVSFEVDPQKKPANESLQDNIKHLKNWAQQFFDVIVDSVSTLPTPLRHLCCYLERTVKEFFPDESYGILGGFLFLRFICPSIVTPERLNVIDTCPSREARRGLVIIAKMLQNLANGLEYGDKEAYMVPLNSFIKENTSKMHSFYAETTNIEHISLKSKQQLENESETVLQRIHYIRIHNYLHNNLSSITHSIRSHHTRNARRVLSSLNNVMAALGTPEREMKAVETLGIKDLETLVHDLRDPARGIFSGSNARRSSSSSSQSDSAFSAYQLIDWLLVYFPLCETRADASYVGTRLVELQFIRGVEDHDIQFSDTDTLYVFEQELNENIPTLNGKRTWRDDARHPCIVSSDLLLTIVSIYSFNCSLVGFNVSSAMTESIAKTSDFKMFSLGTEELTAVRLRALTHQENLAFWINIYNTLALHAYVHFGPPTTSSGRGKFFSRSKYNVAGLTYSLSDIEHCILRAPLPKPRQWGRLLSSSSESFRKSDPRHHHVVTVPEPRIAFAINSGSTLSPPLFVYTPSTINEALNDQASEYLEEHLEISLAERTVVMPRKLGFYYRDWGSSKAGMLRELSKFLSPTKQATLSTLLSSTSKNKKTRIRYHNHKWDFFYNFEKVIQQMSLLASASSNKFIKKFLSSGKLELLSNSTPLVNPAKTNSIHASQSSANTSATDDDSSGGATNGHRSSAVTSTVTASIHTDDSLPHASKNKSSTTAIKSVSHSDVLDDKITRPVKAVKSVSQSDLIVPLHNKRVTRKKLRKAKRTSGTQTLDGNGSIRKKKQHDTLSDDLDSDSDSDDNFVVGPPVVEKKRKHKKKKSKSTKKKHQHDADTSSDGLDSGSDSDDNFVVGPPVVEKKRKRKKKKSKATKSVGLGDDQSKVKKSRRKKITRAGSRVLKSNDTIDQTKVNDTIDQTKVN